MADRIKILIVDDNEDTRYSTQQLLELVEKNFEVIGFATNGLEAIERVKETNPDIVLMDINMPVMDGLQATKKISASHPRTMIIIVSVQDDSNYMREAFRAGAVDFVSKPISADELANVIESAYKKRPSEQASVAASSKAAVSLAPTAGKTKGRVIGVLGPKGGVGKTTIAVNLGYALMKKAPNTKVLVIDGNTFLGDVGLFLNLKTHYSLAEFAVLAEDIEQIDQQTIDTAIISHESGLKIIGAPTMLDDVRAVPFDLFINLIQFLKDRFDYIIIDTNTIVDDVMSGTIQIAERLVMLVKSTMPSIKNTRIVLSEIRGMDLENVETHVVVNMQPANSRISSDQIGEFLKMPVSLTIPLDNAAGEAINRGIPLASLDPKRVVSVKPIMSLADLLIKSYEKKTEGEEDQEDKKKSFSLFG